MIVGKFNGYDLYFVSQREDGNILVKIGNDGPERVLSGLVRFIQDPSQLEIFEKELEGAIESFIKKG